MTTTLSLHGLTTDLRTMVAAETPMENWPAHVEALIGRGLSVVETANLFQTLGGYRAEPGLRLWQDAVRRLARLLIAGGLS